MGNEVNQKAQPRIEIVVAMIGAIAVIVAAIISRPSDPPADPTPETVVLMITSVATPTTIPEVTPSAVVEPSPTSVPSNTPIPTDTLTPTPIPSDTPISNVLKSCVGMNNETRIVQPGTFIMGHIEIDSQRHYYDGGIGENTVAYFEREATVFAQWGTGCYLGRLEHASTVISREYETGCDIGCERVRFIIIREDGTSETSCHYENGSIQELIQNGNQAYCPEIASLISSCPIYIETGVGKSETMNIIVDEDEIAFINSLIFDNYTNGVFVTITGPYSGQHTLKDGAFCGSIPISANYGSIWQQRRDVQDGRTHDIALP